MASPASPGTGRLGHLSRGEGSESGSGPCLTKSLRPQATEVRINPVEFNPDFIVRMIPKVEWAALLEAADNVRTPPPYPVHTVGGGGLGG